MKTGDKFIRKFFMEVEGANNTYQIASPLTLELDITRGAWQSVSFADFSIYNLAESVRSDIYLDWINQFEKPRKITLWGGYESWKNNGVTSPTNGLYLIFNGQIRSAQSGRDGPSWVTKIAAWDGGWDIQNTAISYNQAAGSQFIDVLNNVIKKYANLSIGYIDPTLDFTLIRGLSFHGSVHDILTTLANKLYADYFVDNMNVYFVSKGQPIPGMIGNLVSISSADGLIDTPIKQKFYVSFNMIFEPRIQVGQAVKLESLELENNGTYTIRGLEHHGVISDAVDGGCTSRITCFYPNAFQKVSPSVLN